MKTNTTDTFISCDWGTSAFRLRLVNAGTQNILASIKTNQGIAAAYNDWKNSQPPVDRNAFYSHIIASGIAALESEYGQPLTNHTVVVSGMASSSIGMVELPYKTLPFKLDGTDVVTRIMESSPQLPYKLLFISGAKTHDDVMRGEETKLVGCKVNNDEEEQLIILPGTHTKHAVTRNGMVTAFDTFMTGELFHLLSTKSVLATSVSGEEKEAHTAFFLKGVAEGADNHLLNSLFHVRTARLFDHHTAPQNFQYLSGLLIGSELRTLVHKSCHRIILLATGVLAPLYRQALEALDINISHTMDADEALVAGQCHIFLNQQPR